MTVHGRVEATAGRKRTWAAPNGQSVVLPLLLTAWEDNPSTGEREWTITARVELIGGRPQATDIRIHAEDGVPIERAQRDFRWATPADIVAVWMPDVLERGDDPFTEEPPINWWAIEGRRELNDEFLSEIAAQYIRLGRGYAKPMAAKYRTSERTIRSWIDKARERGLLGPAPGRGRLGGAVAVVMTEED